ncbi:phenylpropionate dioxygenase-like ring-hydroxylating dioxygenase large terminal subunit [Litorivivens lipolytica]|uniref:Phenylpropionate dioxygenase-like ring-hydroxylating dioxygenase large terminal subunit n=1 Tax=Litorivivens lipolytica TaxID=1524264 RepID=A0A7W4W4W8_9GAMM|nr:Rieske 2Fe-2S domain-containing protein [Litorivivens lipolytica]MBB3047203.1 phenylpropionate dioxygenase-like ring-hydroxylating dioxygenase large terminal subunit [Litorivivens lipolytica]
MAINLKELVNSDASLISRRVWSDEAVYQLEKRAIFGKTWLFLGHESQIKSAGDFVQAYMCETPIILARGENGDIHASINSCTHRGLPVCRSDHGNTKRFICPYHNWSYSVDGSLVTIPQERAIKCKPDKRELGLKKVPRVETWRGLIFGSFNEAIEPLEDYLGDMKFYLGAWIDRFPGGIEFIGSPHRWVIDTNWKLPVENQLGDVYHGPHLHASIIAADSEAGIEIDNYAYNVVPTKGHGASFRLMPEDTPTDKIAWGFETPVGQLGSDELKNYLRSVQATAEAQVGPVRARMKGLAYGVYPNLSFLWSNAGFKVSHPRGPNKVEYWSWSVVPADAPEHLKQQLRNNHASFFGPGGLLEQEDSEAWIQQNIGANIDFADDRMLYYGLGLGEETTHPDLPGTVTTGANEYYARAFFQRWREDLLAEVDG